MVERRTIRQPNRNRNKLAPNRLSTGAVAFNCQDNFPACGNHRENSTLKKYALLIFSLILTGCGPVYETQYTYVRPENPEGVTCIFQCENTRMQCVQSEQLKRQNCEANNRIERLEYERCVSKKGKDKCFEYWTFCESNEASCTVLYNQCYHSCGGQVQATRVCVYDCN